jgi:hypothetical protein
MSTVQCWSLGDQVFHVWKSFGVGSIAFLKFQLHSEAFPESWALPHTIRARILFIPCFVVYCLHHISCETQDMGQSSGVWDWFCLGSVASWLVCSCSLQRGLIRRSLWWMDFSIYGAPASYSWCVFPVWLWFALSFSLWNRLGLQTREAGPHVNNELKTSLMKIILLCTFLISERYNEIKICWLAPREYFVLQSPQRAESVRWSEKSLQGSCGIAAVL